jgi:lipoprotein-releasing system permease protein
MALILVIAVMTGFQDEIRERILGINPHVLVLGLTGDIKDPDKIVNTVKDIKGVTHSFPFISFQAMVQTGKQLSGALVKGLNAGDVQFMSRLMKQGGIDAIKSKGNVLIGKELSKHLGVLYGDTLTIMVPFGGVSPMGAVPETVRAKVGGIFETGVYDIDNTLIIMSIQDIEAIMGAGVTGIEVKIDDVYRADSVRSEIMKRLGPSAGYFARTWIEMNRNLFSALKLEKIAMFIILALIIFVASFNIISSLIMTVMEKKKDIAILKAIGAKKASLMKIFMVEGITIGILGALIGSFSGYILCEIQRRFSLVKLDSDIYYINTLPVKISILDAFLVASITTIICILATLYPSHKASKIDPVETLRYE